MNTHFIAVYFYAVFIFLMFTYSIVIRCLSDNDPNNLETKTWTLMDNHAF